MKNSNPVPNRREFLRVCGTASVMAPLLGSVSWAALQTHQRIARQIPGTKESIPVIGMGSWGTFDIGDDEDTRVKRARVLQAFFDGGGALIDSSPMYGTSEENIGHCLGETGSEELFSATKVWVRGQQRGIEQMNESARLWGVPHFDLMQIHNFLDWQKHLQTLIAWKKEGRIRYIGITTSHGRRADEMAEVIATQPDIDFIQISYNLADRDAERRLLPLAAEHGKAVIINRPFRRKQLINDVIEAPLPDWAAEIDCQSWPQFLLKFIVSHPAVTCAIPATSRVDHMVENMGACYGALPDAAMRKEMIRYFESI